MRPHRLLGAILAALLLASGPAPAQDGRGAVLDRLARGTAAFRTGDIAAATGAWSEALRSARQIGAADLEAEALARRGEANRVAGYLDRAREDLRGALATAEASGNHKLIAASSGALGNLELAAQHPETAEPLLTRARDLARQLGDRGLMASAGNDLGNLYTAGGRFPEAAQAYADALGNAEAARDEVLAGTIDINTARLALRRNDPAAATTLLTRAVARLERAPPSYAGGLALVSAGNTALEGTGPPPPDRQARRGTGLPGRAERRRQTAQRDPVVARPRQSRPARRAYQSHRRRLGADRPRAVRGAGRVGAGIVVPLGLAAGPPPAPARPG